ncbi:hypothetical protein HN587_07490 [Candidatus Woesearchaeota archaeon]|jgi:hypothetical protein|nr:hypothetical protein [Candidatus Woesearchaeota archaeon]
MKKLNLETISEDYVVYVLTTPQNANHLNTEPLGLEAKIIDATNLESSTFLELLHQLDGISYGNKEMAMDKWVTLDCGILPSAFIGLALPADKLPPELKAQYDLPPNYTGLVPISEFCAIPTANPETWITHTLASAIPNIGVGTYTEAIGFSIIPAKNILIVAQYDNHSLKVHSKFGVLKLISATTPAHSQADMTCIYEIPAPSDQEITQVLETNKPLTTPSPSYYLEANDTQTKQAMHQEIKQGTATHYIVYPGIITGPETLVPILKKQVSTKLELKFVENT